MKSLLCALLPLSLSSVVFGASTPVARWEFGEEDVSRAKPVGAVQRDVPGPRTPEYPGFDRGNTAIRLDGTGARLELADPGPASVYDFTNGDAITLEAWVQVEGQKAGENVYIIGKGRTGAPGFAADNQNWALRLRTVGNQYSLNFLFATPRVPDADRRDAHWHR